MIVVGRTIWGEHLSYMNSCKRGGSCDLSQQGVSNRVPPKSRGYQESIKKYRNIRRTRLIHHHQAPNLTQYGIPSWAALISTWPTFP